MNSGRGLGLLIGCMVGGVIVCSKEPVLAQNITLDGTLGPARTLTGPNYVIPQAVGQTVGSNLFHSFGQFNLKTGEVAQFQSAANIRNILSRITGGPSAIDGLISTQSRSVNLFLLNPNGIVFGPNAQIDVGGVNRGSFVATTVDALVWPNGGQFSAINPSGPASLLTIVGDPSGFLASLRPPQAIVSTSQLLATASGQSLLLLGGEVKLDGSRLQAAGGRVELGGVAGAGIVGLQADGKTLQLSFPDNVARADVGLTNGAIVDVIREGGSLAVHARNLEMSGGSELLAGIGVGGTADSKAGDIEVDARSAVHLKGSYIGNFVGPRATGKSGDVRITTGSLSLTNGAQVIASTFGRGNAGNIIISARDAVSFDGVGSNGFSSAALSTVEEGAVGQGGSVEIDTGSLKLTNGAQVAASTFGRGNAGNVIITARDAVSFDGVGSNGFSSAAGSTVEKGAVGQGGSIEINTGFLNLTNGGEVAASTKGQGNAGNITVSARDAVSFDGVGSDGGSSGAFSTVFSGAVGQGGSVKINTGFLNLTNGGVVAASTGGQGNAGNITVSARDAVSFDGVGSNGGSSGAFSTVSSGAVGQGGSVEINTGSLNLINGAYVSASTGGQGNAGNITVSARDAVSFDGVGSNGFSSGAFSAVEEGAVGQGGSIEIPTGSLKLSNGAEVVASTFGRGNAGNVIITARDAVSFDRVGSNGRNTGVASTVEKGAVGQGGDVRLATNSLAITNGAALSVRSLGQGVAGNVAVNARTLFLDRGTIEAITASSDGGNIGLQVGDLLLLRHGSLISTTAGIAQAAGNGGNITIDAPLIVAVPREDSDIRANAFTGTGGNIRIATQGIFGLQYRPQDTPLSDITASSQFGVNGTVQINTPGIDPSRGIANLPTQPVDASRQIAQGCPAGVGPRASKFVVTGRGGLPPTPQEATRSESPLADLGTPVRGREHRADTSLNPDRPPATPTIEEAQGWVYGPHGEVILTATAPTLTPQNAGLKSATCPQS